MLERDQQLRVGDRQQVSKQVFQGQLTPLSHMPRLDTGNRKIDVDVGVC